MSNYDSDTAFFGVVNSNANIVNANEKNQKRAEEYFESIENAVQSSVRVADVKAESHREFKENVERLKKQRNLRIAALILAATSVVGSMIYAGKKISEQQNIKFVTSMAVKDAEDQLTTLLMLKQGGSVTFLSENGARSMFNSLSTNDYSKLSVDNLGQIYSFKLVLGDIEFEEFIKSLTYLENGEVRHYVNSKQFLNKHGFKSEKEFINKAEAILLEQYSGEINKGKGGI